MLSRRLWVVSCVCLVLMSCARGATDITEEDVDAQVQAARSSADILAEKCYNKYEVFTIALVENIIANIHRKLNMDCNVLVWGGQLYDNPNVQAKFNLVPGLGGIKNVTYGDNDYHIAIFDRGSFRRCGQAYGSEQWRYSTTATTKCSAADDGERSCDDSTRCNVFWNCQSQDAC